MEATLKFDLPEESDEFTIAANAMGFALVCSDLDGQLRSWMKYGYEYRTAHEALEAVRQTLHELMEGRLVSLDMVI